MRYNLKRKEYQIPKRRPILVPRYHARIEEYGIIERLKGVSMLTYIGISIGTVFVTFLQFSFNPSSKVPLSAYSLELKLMHTKCMQRSPLDPECDLIKKLYNKSLASYQEDNRLN